MDDSILDKYLNEIGREALLSDEEEQRLAMRIKAGDQRAMDRLVQANLRFVVTIARQYQGRGLALDDLVSEGNVALVRAAAKFDGSRGLRFVKYAVGPIRKAIEKALEREGAEQRVEATRNGGTRSVDTPFNGRSNMSLLSVLTDGNAAGADERVYSNAVEEAVEYALRSLSERELHVVRAFFGMEQERQTMAEIADEMGLKRERVRQIRNQALRRLRKHYRRRLSELRR